MKQKRFIDILPNLTNQYDIMDYAPDFDCPFCGMSGLCNLNKNDVFDKPTLIGYCDTPQGYMAVFECPHCFERYRFHCTINNNYDIDEFNYMLLEYYVDTLPSCTKKISNSEELKKSWEKYCNE